MITKVVIGLRGCVIDGTVGTTGGMAAGVHVELTYWGCVGGNIWALSFGAKGVF